MENNFELLVRALIIQDRKILVCKNIAKEYYFLPGGHIEFGESMKKALARELYEEIGAAVINLNFIGGVENIFLQDEKQKHEMSFLFHTDINLTEVESKESHISFLWMSIEEFGEAQILPENLKKAVTEWVFKKEMFFIEEK